MKPQSSFPVSTRNNPYSRVKDPTQGGRVAPPTGQPATPTVPAQVSPGHGAPAGTQPPPVVSKTANLAGPDAGLSTPASPLPSNPTQAGGPAAGGPGTMPLDGPFSRQNNPFLTTPAPLPPAPARDPFLPPPGFAVPTPGSSAGPADGEDPFVWLDNDARAGGHTPGFPVRPPMPGIAPPVSPDKPFFAIPGGGMPVPAPDTPSLRPAETPPLVPSGETRAWADIRRHSDNSIAWMGLHERTLLACEQLGLSPDAVRFLLDLFLDNSVADVKKLQQTQTAAGLGAEPVDLQALRATALARRAEAGKNAAATRLALDKQRSSAEDSPTFDPTRNTRRHQQGGRPAGDPTTLSGQGSRNRSDSGNLSRSTSQQLIQIDNSDDPDDGDSAAEESTEDSHASTSGTQSDDSQNVSRQQTSQSRTVRQKRSSQDDQVRAAVMAYQARAQATLEQELKAASDATSKKNLLLNARQQLTQMWRTAQDDYQALALKGTAASHDEQAKMTELRFRQEAYAIHSEAIVRLASQHHIAPLV